MPNGAGIINTQSRVVKSIKGGTKRLTVTGGNIASQASALIMQTNVSGQ